MGLVRVRQRLRNSECGKNYAWGKNSACGENYAWVAYLCVMKVHFAPLQGNTDAAYRNTHASMFTPAEAYYTPFIRLESGDIRKRDLKDISQEENPTVKPVPQIIFRDAAELNTLTERLHRLGERRMDLNMGCPFPPQTSKGRGAALAGNAAMAAEVTALTKNHPDIDFSVKMRLGMREPDEWRQTLPLLNEARLTHITLHPRVAAQQYGGETNLGQFGEFLRENAHRTIYNGDIRTPEDILRLQERFPGLEEVMVGRGLIARPSLTNELAEGKEWEPERRLEALLGFHRALLDHYRQTLCGDQQVLTKIRPFWEYSEAEIGRKPWKAIRKATSMAKYLSAVALINN